MREKVAGTKVQTIGFKPKMKVDDVAGVLRQLLVTGSEFGIPVHISNSDVKTAFDLMRQKWQVEALSWKAGRKNGK